MAPQTPPDTLSVPAKLTFLRWNVTRRQWVWSAIIIFGMIAVFGTYEALNFPAGVAVAVLLALRPLRRRARPCGSPTTPRSTPFGGATYAAGETHVRSAQLAGCETALRPATLARLQHLHDHVSVDAHPQSGSGRSAGWSRSVFPASSVCYLRRLVLLLSDRGFARPGGPGRCEGREFSTTSPALCGAMMPFNGFPSGHITWTVIFLISLWRLRHAIPKTAWIIMIWISLVIPATVMLRQHYLMDVYAGIFLGFATYWAVMFVVERPKLAPSMEGRCSCQWPRSKAKLPPMGSSPHPTELRGEESSWATTSTSPPLPRRTSRRSGPSWWAAASPPSPLRPT